MSEQHDVNLNQAEVIQSANHWGFTRYHNVVRGTFYDVPWGAWDWIWLVVGGLLVVGFVGGMAVLFTAIGVDIWSMHHQ